MFQTNVVQKIETHEYILTFSLNIQPFKT